VWRAKAVQLSRGSIRDPAAGDQQPGLEIRAPAAGFSRHFQGWRHASQALAVRLTAGRSCPSAGGSGLAPESSWFWATHGGAELDLLVLQNGLRIGVEIKRADAPRLSVSMRQALTDLELDRLLVITPGERSYRLNERTQVLTLAEALGSAGPRP
jgi:predicted AAA+ superfamily ATPase